MISESDTNGLGAGVRAALLGLSLLACSPGATLDEAECPPGGTTVTYAGFVAPFLDQNCQRCHAAAATDRHGAPDAYTFDTEAEVRAHAERIYARAADENDSMPPGPDDPPLEDRLALGEWLACYAK